MKFVTLCTAALAAAATGAAAAAFGGAPPAAAGNDDPLHIIVIVADDLGFNDVTWHGSEQIPIPNLQKLADSGLVLDNYYVQPVCSPTRSTILTGRHVIHSGIYDPDCGPGNTNAVPLNFTMIPEHLAKIGYETHAIGKWHLGSFSRSVIPTGKGFDAFFGYYSGAEDYFTHVVDDANDMHNDTAAGYEIPDVKGQYSTYIYNDRAVEVIKDFAARRQSASADEGAEEEAAAAAHLAKKNLFMYLAFQAIHSPDEVPDQYRDRFNASIPDTKDGVGQHRRIVAGMVACLDEAVGNVTQALDDAGMLEHSLIVFTTDNGGPAQGFNGNMASNWPLRGMKRTLWQGGVRGAAFVRGPGIRAAGEVSHDLLQSVDWFPTLLTAAGTQAGVGDWRAVAALSGAVAATTAGDSAPAKRGVPPFQLGDGVDAWPTLSTGAPSARSEVLIEAHNSDYDPSNAEDGNGQAIVVGDLKLILEKGPMWHGPPNDGWYDSGSLPEQYNHTVDCGGPPPKDIKVALPPALFNLTADPCEYHDIKEKQPDDYKRLLARLAVYQATAVDVSFHDLPLCDHPSSDVSKPVDGNWMPVCP